MGKNPNAAIYYIKTLNSPQRTIAREVAIDGHGGFISEPAKVILVPANPKFLIPRSEAPFKTTSLRYCDARILTVEHLLAVLYGLGITNLHVIVEPNGCIPFSDGSSEVFTRALLTAGLREQPGARKTRDMPEKGGLDYAGKRRREHTARTYKVRKNDYFGASLLNLPVRSAKATKQR